MKQQIIEKIKPRGYWRINFQPLVDEIKFKSLNDCKEAVQNNRVQLRGWDYPHFPIRKDDTSNTELGKNYFAGYVDWFNHIEYWRMFQSGQFIHYLALREDWSELDGWNIVENQNLKQGAFLGIVGTIYQMTEIFEFLSRLTAEGIYNEGVRVSITLENTEKRALRMEDSMRDFFMAGKYESDMISMPFLNEYSKDDLITKPHQIALEVIMYFFERFNWDRMPLDSFKKDQDDFLKNKI
jgi:hypothetical protein